MKAFLSNYGGHLDEVERETHRITELLPPTIQTEHGLDLDFASFLLHDGLVLDKTSYDFILTNRSRGLKRLAESVTVLLEEGSIETRNYANIIQENLERIRLATAHELRDPDAWLDEIVRHMDGWQGIQEQLVVALEGAYSDPVAIPFGVYRFINSISGERCDTTQVGQIIRAHKKRRSNGEKDVIRGVVSGYLHYAHVNIILRDEFGLPFIEWRDMNNFYRTLYERRLYSPESTATQQSVKSLFTLSLPELRPKSVAHFLTILRDPRLKQVREKIYELSSTGQAIDIDLGKQVLIAARRAEVPVGKIKKVTTWAGRLVSLLPGASIPSMVVEDATVAFTKHKMLKDYEWFYCLWDAEERHSKSARRQTS